jgi:UDP-N-acetylglucosamine 2-epimerase (non-hydrolysing)
MTVLSLVGARPQIIKEAVLNKEFQKAGIKEILVHSGQHYDYNMSDVFFKVLDIRQPDYNLNVGSGTHAEMTARIMIEFEKVLVKEKPDIVLVYGDTNTTLAGSLVGAKLKIPVAHVEAGLRQKPKDMPEEINRIVTDHVSSLLFCPSQLAVENLKKEGIIQGVHFVGDVMYELFLKMKPYFTYELIEQLGLKENSYIVCTIHRDFNTDVKESLETIFKELSEIAREMKVVFPIHPRTRKKITEFGLYDYARNLTLIDPVDYLAMMGLVEKSLCVITDSGGLQKEAYWCGKRAIIVMPDTGWRELIESGWNRLAEPGKISETLDEVLKSEKVDYPKNVYGEGDASQRIVRILQICETDHNAGAVKPWR